MAKSPNSRLKTVDHKPSGHITVATSTCFKTVFGENKDLLLHLDKSKSITNSSSGIAGLFLVDRSVIACIASLPVSTKKTDFLFITCKNRRLKFRPLKYSTPVTSHAAASLWKQLNSVQQVCLFTCSRIIMTSCRQVCYLLSIFSFHYDAQVNHKCQYLEKAHLKPHISMCTQITQQNTVTLELNY